MEREDLLKMVQLYKTKLADMEEQNLIYQVIISNQAKEKEILSNKIDTLECENTKINAQIAKIYARLDEYNKDDLSPQIIEAEVE